MAAAVTPVIMWLARSFIGPFRLGFMVRSPLTAEMVFSVSFILLVIARAKDNAQIFRVQRPRGLWALAVLVGTALCYWGVQTMYFIGDDFFVVMDAVNGRGREFVPSLFHAGAGEIFYRPVAYALLWVSALACAVNPLRWHLLTLAIHLFNCGLLYAIAVRLGLPAWASMMAMAIFGVHGSRPESVVWTTGYFELVSASFVFLSLYLYLGGEGSHGRLLHYGALAAFLSALWCKESAYAFPLILIALPRGSGSKRRRKPALFVALAAAAFIHRFIVLGGIGGYATGGFSSVRFAETAQRPAVGCTFFPD